MKNTKSCTRCKSEQDIDTFYWKRDKGKNPRRYSECKKCRNIMTKYWHDNNKEKVSQMNSYQRNKDIAKSRERDRVNNTSPGGKYAKLKYVSKKRGDVLNITFETFKDLISGMCYYCESPLNKSGHSLDRIDSSKGYMLENVVPCCMLCNKIKSNHLSFDEMRIIGQAVRRVKEIRFEQTIKNLDKMEVE